MKSISIFCFVLILALSSRQILANDLISQTCDQTLYKDLCKSTLSTANAADLNALAKTALSILSQHATGMLDQIKKLSGTSPDKAALTDCSGNYKDAVDKIKDSQTAVDSRSYNDVNTWISAAMSSADSCESGFEEKPGSQSPLKEMNAKFSQLCSICLTITNLLAKT